MDKLTHELGALLAAWLEAYEDNYDASCEDGEHWHGGSYISDHSLADNSRSVLGRWKRALAPAAKITEQDLENGMRGADPVLVLIGEVRLLLAAIGGSHPAYADKAVAVLELCRMIEDRLPASETT